MAAVGVEIAKARTRAGLSRMELAERMDMTEAQIVALEAGQRCPSVDLLARLADACDQRLVVGIKPQPRLRRLLGRGRVID